MRLWQSARGSEPEQLRAIVRHGSHQQAAVQAMAAGTVTSLTAGGIWVGRGRAHLMSLSFHGPDFDPVEYIGYLLMPVACRKALVDLSDEAATKVQILLYADAADALRKALVD